MKKTYVKPAVLAEDVLEQTSLACNASEGYQGPSGEAFATGLSCDRNVQKGNNFAEDQCEFNLDSESQVVVLS